MKNKSLFAVTFLLLILISAHTRAQIIPSNRQIDWSQSGIPGGIPNRTTIFCDVTLAPYNAVGDDSTDNRAAFQAAFNACPSGQVVTIPAGIYRVNGTLTVPSNITIRGAGTSTIIKSVGTGAGLFNFGRLDMPWDPSSRTTTISSGSTGGSQQIVVANATGITVGAYLVITELNDPAFVTITGAGGVAAWVSGWGDNGTHARGEIVEVTSVNGTAIEFTPALTSDYTHTPWAVRFTAQCQWSGVENLKIYATNSGTMRNFFFRCAAYCWVKDVECDYADGDHATLDWSYRCEIRGSYFHDAYIHLPGQYDTMIGLRDKTSRCLVVDNILRRLHVGVMLEWGACGNVIAYNYSLENFDERAAPPTNQRVLMGCISINHGAHPQFNLIEGNVCTKIESDNYWGSASHNTIFRNHSLGHGYANPPFSGRGVIDTGTVVDFFQQARALDIWDGQTSFNIVGNVLGDNYSVTHNAIRRVDWPVYRHYEKFFMFTYGYTNYSDSGTGTQVNSPVPTMIDHGNWDAVSGTVAWDSTIPDHALPYSLCFTSKPTWFGNVPWPAIGPDVNGFVNKIPAQVRFESLPAINSFTANPAAIAQDQSSVLSWTVSNADSLSINQGLGTVSGTSTTVSPAATTTYTLSATNSIGSSTAIVTVTVQSGGGGGGDSGGGGGGGGCFIAAAGHGLALLPVFLPLFLFFLGIGLAG